MVPFVKSVIKTYIDIVTYHTTDSRSKTRLGVLIWIFRKY